MRAQCGVLSVPARFHLKFSLNLPYGLLCHCGLPIQESHSLFVRPVFTGRADLISGRSERQISQSDKLCSMLLRFRRGSGSLTIAVISSQSHGHRANSGVKEFDLRSRISLPVVILCIALFGALIVSHPRSVTAGQHLLREWLSFHRHLLIE